LKFFSVSSPGKLINKLAHKSQKTVEATAAAATNGDGQTDGQTDGHGLIDSAVDPDQEYISFWGSATRPSACYIHSAKHIIPFFAHF